jgi:uncharacterized membrane protein (UPF0127 family)
MKRIWLFFLIILIILIGLFLYFILQTNQVCFDKTCFKVELAKTSEQRIKGLMDRESLDENKGMLFIYPEEGKYDFWMKNTLIPLDIIWINKNKEVVFINKNTQPCLVEECPAISPPLDAKYILEINGGLVDKLGIIDGDHCILK